MLPRLSAIVLALLVASGTAWTQTVYESRGTQGKVYSDRPLPGSKAVELRPLTVIEPVPVPPAVPVPAAESGTAAAKVAAYRTLTVVFPEAEGSVAANHATFEVRVAVDPPLQIGQGHAFALRLDGRPVPGRYTATEMMVPPEFFGNVAPAGVQRHVIEASIVDAGGQVLLVSPPVEFQTRFVTVLQRPRAQPPHRVPPREFRPLPETKPAPAPASELNRLAPAAAPRTLNCSSAGACRDGSESGLRPR
jgi:hypothetical protein